MMNNESAISGSQSPEQPATASTNQDQSTKISQQQRVSNALNAVSDFEKKWKEFQNLFQQMNEALVNNLSRQFGVKPEDLAPVASDEEKKIPFGGKQPSAQEIAKGIQSGKYQKIIVLCGAGMSTSAGIPDFRSPDTGVYAQLKKEQEKRRARYGHLSVEEKQAELDKNQEVDLDTLPNPEALFTLDFYRQNQRPFILRAGHMWPGKACEYRPTPSHCFLKLIEKQLLRVYTQNIDELETWNNLISRDKVRRCHGSYERVHCTMCDASFNRGTPEYEKVYQSMVCEGKSVKCWECTKKNPLFAGVMKPGIVFFGEAMSEEFSSTRAADFKECDLVIVVGTSLMVQPFCTLPERVKATVPRLLINGEIVGNSFKKSFEDDGTAAAPLPAGDKEGTKTPVTNYRDAAMIGDIDRCVSKLADWMGCSEALAGVCRQYEAKNQSVSACLSSKNSSIKLLPETRGKTQIPTSSKKTATLPPPPISGSEKSTSTSACSEGLPPLTKQRRYSAANIGPTRKTTPSASRTNHQSSLPPPLPRANSKASTQQSSSKSKKETTAEGPQGQSTKTTNRKRSVAPPSAKKIAPIQPKVGAQIRRSPSSSTGLRGKR